MEYRVTKFNPKDRDRNGCYLLNDEWVSFSDIGKLVTQQEYEATEEAYINSAIAMLHETNCTGLNVICLENTEPSIQFEEGDFFDLLGLKEKFRAVLREEVWCKFETNSHFVHFGYDYYMYVGTPHKCINSKAFVESNGLFVEEYNSPYRSQSY